MSENCEYKKQYLKNGFVHIKNVVSRSEIDRLYGLIVSENSRPFVLGIDKLVQHPDIYSMQFNKKILSVVREIFGNNACLLNDINIQVDQFYNDRDDDGWHVDAGGERLARYLFKPGYGYAKVGLYLKDNSNSVGGGIDAEIGGHKSFRYFGDGLGYVFSIFAYFIDRIFISRFRKKSMIDTKGGDVLIFDSRLPHRSTPKNITQVEAKERKVTLYWQVAKDHKNANDYLGHAMKMEVSDPNGFRHYAKFLSYKFPDDYPDQYVKSCEVSDMSVASLTDCLCDRYKNIEYPDGKYDDVFFAQK